MNGAAAIVLKSIRLLPALAAALLLLAAPAVAGTPASSPLMDPASFWNTPLHADASLNTPDTAAVGTYLGDEAVRSAPYVNTTKWTAAAYTVPATQPLVPVRLRMPNGGPTPPYAEALEAVLRTGLPIPAGYTPQGDGDDTGAFWMPSWVGTMSDGTVLHGRIYEAWRLRPNTDPATPNIAWEAQWGGRMSGVAENVGHYVDRYTTYRDRTYPDLPTDPVKANLFEEKGWGSMATSLPIYPSMVKASDVQAGVIHNAIGLTVPQPAAGWRWPAMRSDGSSTSTSPVQEGMRLRLPPDYVAPPGLNSFVQMVIAAARDYGFVVTDRAANLAIRAEPAVAGMLPTAAYAALKGFPWGSLQVLSTGDDQNPTPLTGPVDDGGNPPGAQGSPPPGGTPAPPGGTPPPPGGTPPPPAGTPPAAGARPAATAPQPSQGAAPRTNSPRPTDTTAPTASLSATQTQTLGRTLVLKVKCASERCVARAGGAIRVPKVGRTKARTLKLKTVSLSIDQGTMATIKLSLSAAQRHAIKRASREHKAVRATLTITVADTAGNTRTLQQTMRLKLQS